MNIHEQELSEITKQDNNKIISSKNNEIISSKNNESDDINLYNDLNYESDIENRNCPNNIIVLPYKNTIISNIITYNINDSIRVFNKKSKKWGNGIIIGINSDNSYVIRYENNTESKNITKNNIEHKFKLNNFVKVISHNNYGLHPPTFKMR